MPIDGAWVNESLMQSPTSQYLFNFVTQYHVLSQIIFLACSSRNLHDSPTEGNVIFVGDEGIKD